MNREPNQKTIDTRGPSSLRATPVIAAGLSAGYGAGPEALAGLDLRVEPGEVVVIIGPNGSGKSTLVRVLSGILPVRYGQLSLFGRDIRLWSRAELARRVAVVPQMARTPEGYRVEELVMMGRAPHQGMLQTASPHDRALVSEALERVGIGQLAHRRIESLSGGEQRLVALARALVQAPELLLLDEAGAFLDPRHALALHELVRAEARERGVACIVVGHDLQLAASYSDRVLLLDHGRALGAGPAREVMTEARLREAYGVSVHVGHDPRTGAAYFVPHRLAAPVTPEPL